MAIVRVDAVERLATLLSAGRVQHEPGAAGALTRWGRGRRLYVRLAWSGERPPRRLWLAWDDGTLRRRPAVMVAGDRGRWEYLACIEPVRGMVAYQAEAELQGPDGSRADLPVFYGPDTADGPSVSRTTAGWWRVDVDALPPFEVPTWTRGAVFYQIFPDRFFDADPANNPPGTEPWGGEPTFYNFFGGDLEGIRRRLDYLQALGVGAIYLNPIHQAPSNHRYDASDYLKVDPALGGWDDFRRLVEEAHRRRIRVILDAVFNHTGETFWAFQDVVRRGPESPYYAWYHVREWPIRRDPPSYECWWGLPHLPKLNTTHPEVRSYLFDVTRAWMEAGIDGWRLDVPNELEPGFWEEWRRLVKSLNADAYIVGEIWHDADEWLRGDRFDAVMNYPLRDALVDFFVHRSIRAAALRERLEGQLRRYPPPAVHNLMNLLGSHDTERIATVAGGDRRATEAMMLVAMTWPGIPTVYYGDEVGMSGGKDPECRRCFPWDERRQDLRRWRWVRRLAHLRRAVPALAGGEPVTVECAADDVVAFGRLDAWQTGEAAVVVVGRNESPLRLELDIGDPLAEVACRDPRWPGEWVDLVGWGTVTGERRLTVDLAPWGRMILVPRWTLGR